MPFTQDRKVIEEIQSIIQKWRCTPDYDGNMDKKTVGELLNYLKKIQKDK